MGSRTEEHVQYTSSDIARLRNGAVLPARARGMGLLAQHVSIKESNRTWRREHDVEALRVAFCLVALAVMAFVSLGVMGAAGQDYAYVEAYTFLDPGQVAYLLYLHAYDAVADLTHWFSPHTNQWLADNAPGYWAVAQRAGVVGITLVCAVLLSVSGMLYQHVFKNPLAGPNMLGASSGVSLGMMLLVYLYGTQALTMVKERYLYCYVLGALVLAFVMIAGRKLSGRGKPYNIVSVLLIGAIVSQLIGFIVSYVTLFVMDADDYTAYYTLSQMLTVDTSATSWACLGVAAVASLLPVYLLRFKMNALSFTQEEARVLGVPYGRLQGIALLCGAVMILAAQIHTGMVGMVSLVVPFLARSWFGCEFSRQFTGNVCLSMLFLLICRDICDAIPFVGDGVAIGSVVAIAAVPLFVVIMARHLRGWE